MAQLDLLYESPIAWYFETHDPFRMGCGATPLPAWPVDTLKSQMNNRTLQQALMELAIVHLRTRGLRFGEMGFCRRHSVGRLPTDADETLYITLEPDSNSKYWDGFLKEMIPPTLRLGFEGRIEMINELAADGPQIYPHTFSDYQLSHWDDILAFVIHGLRRYTIQWSSIEHVNWGYFIGAAHPAVLVSTMGAPARTPEEHLVAAEDYIARVLEEYGLMFYIIEAEISSDSGFERCTALL